MQMYSHLTSIKKLLADAINEKPEGYIIQQLFSLYPSVLDLLEVTADELIEIRGVGKSKARQIVSALSLARMLNIPASDPYVIRSPLDVVKLIQPEIGHLKHEVFAILFLNTRNHVIDKQVLGVGSLSSCVVHPREIYRAAIRKASASIIAVHNHPGGIADESPEDVEISRRLKEVGELVGIELLDSIIVTGNGAYSSLKEKGYL